MNRNEIWESDSEPEDRNKNNQQVWIECKDKNLTYRFYYVTVIFINYKEINIP